MHIRELFHFRIVTAVVLLGLMVSLLASCGEHSQKDIDRITGKSDGQTADTLVTQPPGRQLNVGFLVLDSVYNTELIAPYDIFHHVQFHTDPSMNLFTVARRSDTLLTTFEGLRLEMDYDLNSAPRIDVLVVPSAKHNLDTDLEDTTVVNWIRERGNQAEYVMSLCDGAFMLAEAGLLDEVKCTTFPGDIPAFKERYPHLDVQEETIYVHDGKMITSAGGARSFDPAMYLVELLYGRKVVEGVGRGMVIDWP